MTKLAVIGVGHLGRHHARILSAMPDVELVGVVDLNQERAEQIAGINGSHERHAGQRSKQPRMVAAQMADADRRQPQ